MSLTASQTNPHPQLLTSTKTKTKQRRVVPTPLDPIKLRMACADGHLFAVMHFLEQGIDPFIVDAYDGRNALMVATYYHHADVVAAMLLYAQRQYLAERLFQGLSIVDNEGWTVHELAIRRDAVGCLSVLLYLRSKSITVFSDDDGGDYIHHLLDLARSCRAHKVEDFLLTRYFNTEKIQIPPGATQALKRTAFCDEDDCTMSMYKQWWTGALYLAALFPKRTVFVCMRITICFCLLMLFSSRYTSHSMSRSVAFILCQLLELLSMIIMWNLYRKVCLLQPGVIMTDQNQDDNIGSDISRSTTSTRKKCRSYEEALELLVTTSSVAGKSTETVIHNITSSLNTTHNSTRPPMNQQIKRTDFSLSIHTDVCCHICRLYRPMRSFHSKVLNRCVPHSDHYCVFLENSVGRDNYALFIAALLLAVFWTLPLFVWNSGVYLYDHSLTHHYIRYDP